MVYYILKRCTVLPKDRIYERLSVLDGFTEDRSWILSSIVSLCDFIIKELISFLLSHSSLDRI